MGCWIWVGWCGILRSGCILGRSKTPRALTAKPPNILDVALQIEDSGEWFWIHGKRRWLVGKRATPFAFKGMPDRELQLLPYDCQIYKFQDSVVGLH